MTEIEVTRGEGAVVLGLPHTGTFVPAEVLDGFNGTGRVLADSDWHIDRLYSGLIPGLTTVRTPVHRYVIDVNRDPEGQSLYPGQNTTGLCPVTDFDGVPIYVEGREPDAAETQRRLEAYHRPYHAALKAELDRVRAKHGFAILYDCHSIRSHIPFLFEGTLPDFNIGTDSGKTCAPDLVEGVEAKCRTAEGYTTVVNGRFKGGWTTRHCGDPENSIHAIQMELAQSAYMQESAPWTWDETKAQRLRQILTTILEQLSDWRPQ